MSKKQITIHVNGESKLIERDQTIESFLKILNINKNNIAKIGRASCRERV